MFNVKLGKQIEDLCYNSKQIQKHIKHTDILVNFITKRRDNYYMCLHVP